MNHRATFDTNAHTPGPWKVYEHDFRTVIIENGDVICEIRKWQDRGNADLLAAAPDLLEALESLASIVQDEYGFEDCERTDSEGRRGQYAKARAAISKARGTV